MDREGSKRSVMSALILFFIITALTTVQVSEGTDAKLAHVTHITPRVGSLNGGTRITIYGVGYANDKFNFGAGREHLGNTVMMVDKYGKEFVCDIHLDGCTEKKVECYTRAMPEGVYYPRVSVDGEPVPLDQHCGHDEGMGSACTFKSQLRNTPRIWGLNAIAGTPGSLITLDGLILTDLYGTNRVVSSNGMTARILRVWVTGRECLLLDEAGAFYGLELVNEDAFHGHMTCKLSGRFVGNNLISFIVSEHYGRSLPDLDLFKLSVFEEIYMYQTFAPITSISTSTGGVNGGATLTIHGDFFDPANIEVKVGGVVAEVVSVVDTAVEVIVPPKPDVLTYMYEANVGNRGMKLEYLESDSMATILLESLLNLEGINVTDALTASYVDKDVDSTLYGVRLSGFTKVAKTGQYSFCLNGDDDVALYWSSSGDPADTLELIVSTGVSTEYVCSDRFSLEAGKPYYLVGVMREKYGHAAINIGLYMFDTHRTGKESGQAKNEIQVVKTISNPTPEQQVLTFPASLTENTAAIVFEAQQVTLTVDDPNQLGGVIWRLGMDGIYTGALSGDASAEDVRGGLMKLPLIYPDPVSVEKLDTSTGVKYTVTFQSHKGNFSLMDGIADPNSEVDVTVTATETRTGVPSGRYISLVYAGKPSPIAVAYPDLSVDTVEESVRSLFEPTCSRTITHPDGLAFSQSYESGEEEVGAEKGGKRSQDIPAFCGSSSYKNPDKIYQHKVNTTVFSIDTYKYMCFAHYGTLNPQVKISYSYNLVSEPNLDAHKIANTFVNIWEQEEHRWNYNCWSLYDMLLSNDDAMDEPMNNFKLYYVEVFLENERQNLYIDQVSLFSSMPSADPQGQADYERLLPAEPMPLRSLTVEEDPDVTNKFTVTMETQNCELFNHLIGLAYVVKVSEAEYEILPGVSMTAERITSASPPITGTYTIQYPGRDPLELDAQLEAHELQSIEAYLRQGAMRVSRSGTCHGYTYEIEWLNNGGDKPDITLTGVDVDGVEADVELSTKQHGGVFWAPIPSDMLFTPNELPQVTVSVNNIPSHCEGDCSFSWEDSITPTLSAISPNAGSSGESLTLTGTGFGDDTSAVTVTSGGAECVITSCADTQIVCTLGSGPAGPHPVYVIVHDVGLATGEHQFTSQFSVSSLSVTSGSTAGGTTTVISGSGFGKDIGVTFGGSDAIIVDVTYDEIVCQTPSGTGTVDVVVSLGADASDTVLQYTYDAALTPTITSLSPTTASVKGGSVVSVDGSGFSGPDGPDKVLLGGVDVPVSADDHTTSHLTLTLPALAPGSYPIHIYVPGKGLAAQGGSVPTMSYTFQVDNVYPTSGSMNGGTIVTLTGDGFSTTTNDNVVHFGDTPCTVLSATETQLTVETGHGRRVHTITNKGVHPDYFEPRNVMAEVGDLIVFKWNNKQDKLSIIETADALQNQTKAGGFFSHGGRAHQGVFEFEVLEAEVLYYWSGFMNDEDYSMRGTIEATAASVQDISKPLSLKIGNISAEQNVGSGVSDPVDSSSCPGSVDITSSTCPTAPSSTDASKLHFLFRACKTPIVTSMDSTDGDASQSITLSGSGFSTTDCQNQVTFGGYECTVQTASATQITCSINPDGFPVASLQELRVVVGNIGQASHEEKNLGFKAMPFIQSISPAQGSIRGGTLVVIQGAGLCHACSAISKRDLSSSSGSQNAVVYIGSVACVIKEITFDGISCRTVSAAGDIVGSVSVSVNSAGTAVAAVCPADNCEFSFSTAATPSITSPSGTVQSTNQILTIEGHLLANVESVKLGETVCTVQSSTTTSVSCDVGTPVAGEQSIFVNTAQGSANVATVTVTGSISSLLPATGSTEGLTELALVGFGFDTTDNATTVSVDGDECEVQSVTSTTITCLTPAHSEGAVDVVVSVNDVTYDAETFTYSSAATPVLTSSSPAEDLAGSTLTLAGSGFGSQTSDVSVMVGSADCAIDTLTDTSIACTLGDSAAGTYDIEVVVAGKGKATGDHTFDYQFAVDSVAPAEGALGGGQQFVVTGRGLNADTTVSVCGNPCVAFDITASTFTCNTPANDGAGDVTCDVIGTQGDVTSTLAGAYTYRASLSASVTGLTPTRGGTGGGTSVTVAGAGFGTDPSGVSVAIGGSPCMIDTVQDDEIVCTSGARTPSVLAPVAVTVNSAGLATVADDVPDFLYIDVWSSSATWGGGSKPTDGDLVVVSAGKTLLIDEDTAVIKMLLINGGTVLFDDTVASINFNAEIVFINDGGLFQIGTEGSPYQNEVTMTMYGTTVSKELPIYGTKGIFVREGTLDLHGMPRTPHFSRLAATASVGSSVITVQHTTNWLVGDTLVIACTGNRFSQSQTEVRIIIAISGDGKQITLESALEYEHLGVTETVGGKELEVRAEVAVMNRNIKFGGSTTESHVHDIPACEAGFDPGEFSTQTCFLGRFGDEKGSDAYGAQILGHAPEPDQNDVFLRIENIQMWNVGQAFRLGRYAIHYHLNGWMENNYVKYVTIYRSHNRAVNIHGTHNVLVEGVVAYDIKGGAFFLEDGGETNNKFINNLAVFVRGSQSLRNDDVTPAGFWATNALNIYINNVVCCGSHFGFWIRTTEHPEGPSYDVDVCPRKSLIGEFKDNIVHSCGWFGLWVFEQYTPMEGGTCQSTVPAAVKFENLTVWNCEKGAEFVFTGATQIHNSLFVNNEKTQIEWKKIMSVREYEEEHTGLIGKGTVVAPYAGALDDGNPVNKKIGITLPLSKGPLIDDVTFANFDQDNTACFAWAKIDGTSQDFNGGFNTWVVDAAYDNSPNRVWFKWKHEGQLRDWSGTLTGTAGASAVPLMNTLPPSCTQDDRFSAGAVDGAVCPPGVDFTRFGFNTYSPASLDGSDFLVTNQWGTDNIPFTEKGTTHKQGWQATFVKGEISELKPEDYQLSNITYVGKAYDLKADEYIIIKHVMNEVPDVFVYKCGGEKLESEAAMLTANSDFGQYYADGDSISYIITGKDADSYSDLGMTDMNVCLTSYKCFFEGCETPVDPNNEPPPSERPDDFIWWSEAKWSLNADGQYVIAADGSLDEAPEDSDILIRADEWVVFDVENSHPYSIITVDGALEIDIAYPDRRRRSTEAYAQFIMDHLFVRTGRFIIGFENSPYTGMPVELVIRGEPFGRELPRLGNGPNIGVKAISVFGAMELHGEPRHTMTYVSADVVPGDVTLEVDDAGDWKVGDVIGVAGSGYIGGDSEVVSITALSGNTLSVTPAFTKYHSGKSVDINGETYSLKAEVGLFSRNIRVVGEEYEGQDTDGFGARVIVGTFSGDGNMAQGYLFATHVAFERMGQYGYVDDYDPRVAIAFLDTVVNEIHPSAVTDCSIRTSYNMGIGVYSTNAVKLHGNFIQAVVGPGMQVKGSSDVEVINNLVMDLLYEGTFAGRDTLKVLWSGCFETHLTTSVILEDNTCAGSERGGFWIDGQPCSTPEDERFKGNVVHSATHGVYMFDKYGDGVAPCTAIFGFTAYRCFDFGVYVQTAYSINVVDYVSIENGQAIYAHINGPSSTAFVADQEKEYVVENAVIAGTLEVEDYAIYGPDENTRNFQLTRVGKGYTNGQYGKTGYVSATFANKHNNAPEKPHAASMSYNTIAGRNIIRGMVFFSFSVGVGGDCDVAIFGAPNMDDNQFPITMEDITLLDVDCPVYIPIPSVGKINPADCVDMDCDGLKKVAIKDLDGSFLGQPGTVFSISELEWDKDPRRGLGDYRIPIVFLSDPDTGEKRSLDFLAGRGIIRDDTCELMPDWNAWKCGGEEAGKPGPDIRMMMLQSHDHDHETRRVSPVAVVGTRDDKKYVDLVNGPQDHGWCSGYTCQKRISLFSPLVSIGDEFEIYFSSTTPQHSRYYLLNSESTDLVLVAVYFAQSWRLDVFIGNTYIAPKNQGTNSDGDTVSVEGDYKPDLSSDPIGTNWFDRDRQQMWLVVGGGEPIDIITSPEIFVSFDLPPMSVDEFFDPDRIVANIAAFFDIPADKIKIVQIVAEGSSRKRRDTQGISFSLLISNAPTDLDVSDSNTLSSEDLFSITAAFINIYQLGNMAEVLGVSAIAGMSIIEPPLPTDSEQWTQYTTDEVSGAVNVQIPSTMRMPRQPNGCVKEVACTSQPKLSVYDAAGNKINQLGSLMSTWHLEASLLDTSGQSVPTSTARLLGDISVTYHNGEFLFTDLAISSPGQYYIKFRVTSPETATKYTVTSSMVVVSVSSSGGGSSGSSEEEGGSKPKPKPKPEEEETWSCGVDLYMPEMYAGKLESPPQSIDVNPRTRKATFSDLRLTAPGRYFLYFTCLSSTSGKTYKFVGEPIDVFPQNYTRPAVEVEKMVSVRYAMNYSSVAGKEVYFVGLMYNRFLPAMAQYNTILDKWTVEEGSVIVAFSVGGEHEGFVDAAIEAIYEEVKTTELTFDGQKIQPSTDMHVDKQRYGDNGLEPDEGLHPGIIAAIVIGAVLFVVIIVAVILVICKVNSSNQEKSGRISPRGIPDDEKKVNSDSPDSRVSSGSSTASRSSGSHLIKGPGGKPFGKNSGRYNVTPGAPLSKDLYPAPTHVVPPSPNKGTENYRKTSPEPAATAIQSPAMEAYGNMRTMSPSDFQIRLESPVDANRHNGPRLTGNMRRESSLIPVDYKMPGAE